MQAVHKDASMMDPEFITALAIQGIPSIAMVKTATLLTIALLQTVAAVNRALIPDQGSIFAHVTQDII